MAKQCITKELNFNHPQVNPNRYDKPKDHLTMISQELDEIEEILNDIEGNITTVRHLENCYPELE